MKVYDAYGTDYNREKAYAEDIEAQQAQANQAKYGTTIPTGKKENQGG